MKNQWRICISSPPDRDKLVVEIFFNDQQFAELNQEDISLNLEIYSRMDGHPWKISYNEVLKVLEDARNKLLNEND